MLEAYVYIHVKDEVSMTTCMDIEHIKENYQNACHLKTTSQNH